MTTSFDWGLLPEDVYKIVFQKEWSTIAKIKRRLLGKKNFPIRISLKPPSGVQALKHINHFQEYISKWNGFKYPEMLIREKRSFREIGEHNVPKVLIINSVKQLLEYLGAESVERSKGWEIKMEPLLNIDKVLSVACIRELETLERMTLLECKLLAEVIRQLRSGIGNGLYLRAVPLIGVDTKFLETYESIITRCLDVLYSDDVSKSGGLREWLGCEPKPTGWLLVRPLCKTAREAFGGLKIFKMSQDNLAGYHFPCNRIIVVENDASGLSLPELSDTIAVIGGGGNVSWMKSSNLKGKRVYYWGDIDSHGFKFLSDARSLCPATISLMMDRETVLQFESRMTLDSFYTGSVDNLTNDESILFQDLKNGKFSNSRLEQEFIAQDYINCYVDRISEKD